MHMEVEKQMSGRCLQWDPAWTLIPGHFPTTRSPHALLTSLLTALFREQARYANSFRQLGRRSKFLLESFGP